MNCKWKTDISHNGDMITGNSRIFPTPAASELVPVISNSLDNCFFSVDAPNAFCLQVDKVFEMLQVVYRALGLHFFYEPMCMLNKFLVERETQTEITNSNQSIIFFSWFFADCGSSFLKFRLSLTQDGTSSPPFSFALSRKDFRGLGISISTEFPTVKHSW